MRWRENRKSDNVEDLRNSSASGPDLSSGGNGGLLRLLPILFRLIGFKGTLILALIIGGYSYFSGNMGTVLESIGFHQHAASSMSTAPIKETASEKELVDFVSVILADTEDTWTALFKKRGLTYRKPHLVLFRGSVKSGCGIAQSAVGPFYCSADEKVYIDLGFYNQLKNRFKAPGDFAQAYVIAHEVGHHVQNLLGISSKVHKARSKLSKTASNMLSVRQELQADCFAGVWANHADNSRHLLEAGDVEEGLRAASAVGDDTLQKQSQGYISPDSFTHGSSAQRVKWFRIGLATGDMGRCNTFKSNGGHPISTHY